MKKLLLIAVLLPAAGPAWCQAASEETTRVIPTGKLAWSDFTGSVDRTSAYWARTEWSVMYTYRTTVRHDTVKLSVQVQPMLKTTSWVAPGRQSEALLAHEQGHFNCALLVAALFRKVATDTAFTRGNYPQEVRQLFAGILAEVKQLEVQYDAETNHMRNKEAQAIWDRKLELLLKAAQER